MATLAETEFVRRVPEGDTHERAVCATCGHVAYENPKIIVGSVIADGTSVLLCRRAIEPSRGLWTLPAGYLELGETLAEGAAREADEEACALIEIEGVLALYSLAHANQVQVIHRARFARHLRPAFGCGLESLEVRLFEADALPWSELAFPSVAWALAHWIETRHAPLGAPATNPPTDPRGTAAPGPTRGATAPQTRQDPR